MKCAFIIAALFSLSLTARAQTNQFYQTGELDVQVGPSLFAPVETPNNFAYGYSWETTYWQTAHTATSLDMGDNRFKRGVVSVLNYSAAREKFRIVPFPNHLILGRFELETETGPIRWLDDGSTGILLGGGIQFAFTKRCGMSGELDQDFDTSAYHTGLYAKLQFVWKF